MGYLEKVIRVSIVESCLCIARLDDQFTEGWQDSNNVSIRETLTCESLTEFVTKHEGS